MNGSVPIKPPTILRHEDIVLDFDACQLTRGKCFVMRGERKIMLPPFVFSLLSVFMKRKGEKLMADELYEETGLGRIKHEDYDPTPTIWRAIVQLRKALGPPNVIKTFVGEGWMLTDSANTPQPTEGKRLPRGRGAEKGAKQRRLEKKF